MQTTITARHCEISDPLRERALTVAGRLGNLANRPIEATVVFDVEGMRHTAELRLQIPRGELLVAKADAEDHRTALDRAEDKLRRQVEKASAYPRRSRPSQAPPV